jgi:UDP-N-acetyl-D-galactosamine dehydrogenase
MTCGKDFTLGYSPERINPGDKEHTVTSIVKIVAGQDEKTLDILADLYGSIVKAGIYKAPSIKVAEMAKAIENAQRDLNIAFINEVAMLCNKIDIQTKDVLAAAGTKWNFLKFQPGLVGGHCIGVDPYYLVEVAKQKRMKTHVITAGRATNDGMSAYIVDRVIEKITTKKAHVLVLGVTFKENIPDTRNSKSFDVIQRISKLGHTVDVDDPFASDSMLEKLNAKRGSLAAEKYDAIFFLVPHKEFLNVSSQEYAKSLKLNGVFFDLKSLFEQHVFEDLGRTYIAL